jgi:4-hydroxy-3-polyprenylbenzoate decarboxylase
VAITGASGAIYGVRALELLRAVPDVETHLILSSAGLRTLAEETDHSADQVRGLADVVHHFKDIGAALSSGSFQTLGMLVAPCSIKTLSGIAHCYNDELIVRAADVCLKERRRVVLLLRETPLHAGHIALMDQATRNGAIIMPPVPAFYHRPQTLDDIVTQTVGRALDLFDISIDGVNRWRDG